MSKVTVFAEEGPRKDARSQQSNTTLFQELVVTSNTTPKGLMGAVVGTFGSGEKAVDLVLIDIRYKHTLIEALARVPDAFGVGAQVQMPRADRRLRVRVIKQFPYKELDPTPEVLKVARHTNSTSLGNIVMGKFVDFAGNNLQTQTVQLKFAGKDAAVVAMNAIEHVSRRAYRELTFSAAYSEEGPTEGHTEGSQAKVVSIVVTLTAT